MFSLKRGSTIVAVLAAVQLGLAAPSAMSAPPPRYVAIDVGTLGGPSAYPNEPGRIVSDTGIVVGTAETPVLNPFAQECDGCHATDAFRWQNGVMTDLGNLGGYNAGLFELNGRGVGVGHSETGALDPLTDYPQVHAAASSNGHLTDLGTLGGSNSWASGINDRGDIAGMATNTVPDPYGSFVAPAYPGATQWHAALWHRGKIQDLGTLGGPDSVEGAQNERGELAGESFTYARPNDTTGLPTWDPFVWQHGKMRDLGSLGGTLGFANWLNDSGEVAGQSDLPGDQSAHPFLWNGRRMIDLGTLGGENGAASWVSESGVVAGSADLAGSQAHHGFLWKHGTMSDLAPVDGAPCSNAAFVGERREAVGTATDCHGIELDAILWQHGRAYNLNELIAPSPLHLITAESVNQRGELLTRALLPDGDNRVVLLVPSALAAREGLHATAGRGFSLSARGGLTEPSHRQGATATPRCEPVSALIASPGMTCSTAGFAVRSAAPARDPVRHSRAAALLAKLASLHD
jgi:probable HAF family extracellular repeat protein